MREKESYLIRKIKDGDKNAFEDIFNEYYTRLTNYAFGLVSDLNVAEDLVEDIFFFIWDNRNIIRVQHSLKAYLYKITHNKCLDYLRKEKVRLKYIKETMERQKEEVDENILFANQFQPDIFSDEMDYKLTLAIESLPEQAKKIFIMKRFDNLSYAEISKKLNISENTIRKQMSRSLQKIRKTLLG